MASPGELDIHDLSRPPNGQVDRWVRWTITVACLVTFLIAVVVPRVVQVQGGPSFDGYWFRNGLALAVGLVIAFAWMPLGSVSRSVRLALVLPVLHLGVMILAWIAWTSFVSRLPGVGEITPAVIAFPMSRVLVVVAAAIVIAGWLIGRSRRGETIHAIVMIALVDLLLVGLWLPIAAEIVTNLEKAPVIDGYVETWAVEMHNWDLLEAGLASPARLGAIILVPPLLGAIGYTWIAICRRHWLRMLRIPMIGVLAVGWIAAIVMRRYATDLSAIVYINFVVWLLAAAAAAIAAIASLSVVTWLAGRRRCAGAWQQQTGRVAAERGELVAGYEITSWLRGPRAITSACEVVTARGAIPVPPGALLIAPLPLATTLLRTGERLAVIRGGDEVGIGGYELHTSGQPFRDSGAPIPSEQGVVIGPRETEGGGQLALVAWRPCLAYLVIVVAVAVPALVTAFIPR